MAQIADKISTYDVGDDPIVDHSWAQRAGSGTFTSAVVSVSGADDPLSTGKIWRMTPITGSPTVCVDEDITATNLDVLCLVRRGTHANYNAVGPCGRVPVTTGSTRYRSELQQANNDNLRLLRDNTSLASAAHGIADTIDEWIWMRLSMQGTAPTLLKTVAWDGAYEDEPADWLIETSESGGSEITAAGHPGWAIALGSATNFEFAYISVGTDGDPALGPGEGGGGSVPHVFLPLLGVG